MHSELTAGLKFLQNAIVASGMEDRHFCGRIVRFGTLKPIWRHGEVRKDGTKLPLQVQPFQVLAVLLKRSGELVTREQLRSRIIKVQEPPNRATESAIRSPNIASEVCSEPD
jgi:DNA-binding response OmpR family regulator